MSDIVMTDPPLVEKENAAFEIDGRTTPFSAEEKKSILADFNREGCTLVRDIFGPKEMAAYRAAVDRVFDDPKLVETHNVYGPYIAVRLFELDGIFRDMLIREPIIGLMEELLGHDCHLIANNIVRNRPGEAIATYHVDERLLFSLPESVERFDPRSTVPTFLLNVQIPLTDIEAEEFGPTQYVSGSHYSGRIPNDLLDPVWEGKRGQSIYCKAGDVYLQHGQVWHRGAPNASNRTRYLLQMSYGNRMIAQRFYPFLNYRMPEHVLEGASPRLLRVLGAHPKGAYG